MGIEPLKKTAPRSGEGLKIAGGRGVEPLSTDPESVVLPLDEPPSCISSGLDFTTQAGYPSRGVRPIGMVPAKVSFGESPNAQTYLDLIRPITTIDHSFMPSAGRVRVGVGVLVNVRVGLRVGVREGVRVRVGFLVGVRVLVGLWVGVRVGVLEGGKLGVALGLRVGVRDGLGVRLGRCRRAAAPAA